MAFRIDIHAKANASEVGELRSSIAQLERRIAQEKKRLGELEGETSAPAAGNVDTTKKQKGGKAPPKVNKSDDDKFTLKGAVQGQVVTRFPPEASGFMHIGHAKAALTNYLLAEKYGGKMVFRFDDTNPVKENPEYEVQILQDTATLGVKYDKVTYTSDRFDELLALMDKMLKDGNAYVDDTEKETMQHERREGIASKRRERTVAENLALWEQMKKGELTDSCVRAKMEVTHDNKCLRDPVLYRSVAAEHCRTGAKYKVYPTYDFACPIVDSLDGVTHALRTSEYNDRNEQYSRICKALGLREPMIEDFSRLNMEFTVMSKRKLTWFVEQKLVDGWNDPRFPTVKGILRRGLTVEALKQFIIAQGMSRANNFQEWGKLWNTNRDVIDPNEGSKCPRYTCVAQEAHVAVEIDGAPDLLKKTRPLHAKNLDLGERDFYCFGKRVLLEEEDMALVKDDEEVTLMSWGNVVFQGATRSADGKRITAAKARNHPEGSVKKTQKLTWLADCPENRVPVELVEYDHLITTVKPDPENPIEDVVNRDSKAVTMAWGEGACKNIKKGDIVQFERRGYYICDSVSPHLVMINIPDGKAKRNHLSFWARRDRLAGKVAEPAAKAAKKDDKKVAADERGMSLEEKRAKKKAEKSKGDAKKAEVKKELDASDLEIRVGKIVEIGPHPDADALFVEKIDLGEKEPRTIVSGLRNFYAADDLKGKLVAVLCNLKPAAVRGVESFGMVLCASTAEKKEVKVLDVPAGTPLGERISFPGFPVTDPAEIHKKKKDALLAPLNTDEKGNARWKEAVFTATTGPITAPLASVTVG
eukprot:TRINITY_DN57748_c0_g1_i1.p2 TRINITY_DN57748_c0_g1~~TRINITY_DN57748_c0_g1_i1.p2  ORF type:complete len:815 (+),score=421.32 TRINITY_DN57748_c0_g1_i1:147-2591(+)